MAVIIGRIVQVRRQPASGDAEVEVGIMRAGVAADGVMRKLGADRATVDRQLRTDAPRIADVGNIAERLGRCAVVELAEPRQVDVDARRMIVIEVERGDRMAAADRIAA